MNRNIDNSSEVPAGGDASRVGLSRRALFQGVVVLTAGIARTLAPVRKAPAASQPQPVAETTSGKVRGYIMNHHERGVRFSWRLVIRYQQTGNQNGTPG